MCSQLAAICHVAFSSAVMGPVGPPNMGNEHDSSARLFSWLNLRVESTTRHCVGVCYELMYVRDSSQSVCPVACFISNSMTRTQEERQRWKLMFSTRDDPGFCWGRRKDVFCDDMNANWDNMDLLCQPRAQCRQPISSVCRWRVRKQISGVVNRGLSIPPTACEASAYRPHQTELGFVDSVKMVIL